MTGGHEADAASARDVMCRQLLWRYPSRHALGPVARNAGFDLNNLFNEPPVVDLILSQPGAGITYWTVRQPGEVRL